MLSFLSFLLEEQKPKPINSSGNDADRHAAKYITPYLPGKEKHSAGSHTVAGDVEHLKAGDKVSLHGHKVIGGVHHVVVSKVGSSKKVTVKANKLLKPFTQRNKGFEGEETIVKHLNKHGLMQGGGAGASAGNDLHLIDKRSASPTKIKGKQGEGAIQGEHKSSIKNAAFGQITLSRHPKTGKWGIDDKARANRPQYATHVENASITVNGRKKNLLKHLNDTHGKDFHSDEGSLEPAHAYLRDHHVDVAHIDSHGTFRAGMSDKRDRKKTGLPTMKGTGRFRVRQKTSDPNKRTVQFEVRKLDKSNLDIGTDEGAREMKKRLGHK